MKKNEIHVAVSGFSGLNNPHPGIAVARALREGWRGPMEIHALGYDSLMTGAWMPGAADQLHLLPPPKDGDAAVLERVLNIHAAVRLDTILPCLDLELPVFSRLAGRLAREGIKTLLPPVESVYATSKLRLPQFAFENEIRTPKTIHVLELGDISLHAEQFGFPLMVKGTVAGAKLVNTVDQARKEARKLNDRWGGGILLQEALSGDEFVVAAVAKRSGACLALVAMRKLGVNPDGKGVFGAVIDDPKIENIARRILDKLDWVGALEMEFIRPYGSNRLYLVEINCRFPSWVMLSHYAGCNLPVLLLRETLTPDHRRKPVKPRPGTMFVRNIEETSVPLDRVDRLERHKSEAGTELPRPRRRRASQKGISVAVTGLGTNDVINPGLGVVAALGGVPEVERIYGLGYGAFDSGLYQTGAMDGVFCLPREDDPEALLKRLSEIHGEAPFDVVLPCLDAEIPRFIKIEAGLEKLGIRTLLPSQKAFDRRRKPNLLAGRISHDWGAFEVPKTYLVRSESDVMDAGRRLGFPVVVKGTVSQSIPANNISEARAAWFEIREMGYGEALVQPLITGDDFAVAVVCDKDHEARAMLTVKKTLTCDRGSTWGAVNRPQPELESAVAAILKHLKWSGPAEAEFIRDDLRERFFLIEINPRFTAWISFTAALGRNHPYQAVCLALDRPYEPEPGNSEAMFMRSCRELPVTARDFAAISTQGRMRND